jgi:site-specific DNA-cytosine methylase
MRTAVSVCSGIGVGEADLRASGFSVEVACEADPRRAEVYRDLYPDALLICGDVRRTRPDADSSARRGGQTF